MTTPTGPEHDPIEGPVRALLWRLRARLVIPPEEQHARSDLDRIVAAAREQAHSAPSPGASSCPPVVADAGTPVFTTSAVGDELAARRRRHGVPHLGRIAAAALVVVATVSGVAGARDGSVTLNTLLGRQSSEAPELAAPDVADDEADLDEVASPLPEIDDEPARQPSDDDAADEPDPAPAGEQDETGSDDAGTTNTDAGTPGTDAGGSDPSGASGSGDEGTDPGSGEGTDDSSGEAREDEADDEGDDADTSEDPTNEVIAAPEAPSNDGVDGMGGRTGCEGEVADCVEADEADDEAAEDVADTAQDAEKAAKERDELANRRFQPSDDDGEGDDPQES